jgi:hypothetical protein
MQAFISTAFATDAAARARRVWICRPFREVRSIESPIVMDALVQVLDGSAVILKSPTIRRCKRMFEHPLGRISIGPVTRGSEHVWLFSRETVASARSLYEAMESAPVRGSLGANMSRAEFFSLRDRVRNTAPWLTHRILSAENWQWLGVLVFLAMGLCLGIALSRVLVHLIRLRVSRGLAMASGCASGDLAAAVGTEMILYAGVALLELPKCGAIHLVASILLGRGLR